MKGCPLRLRKRCRRRLSADRRGPTMVTAAWPCWMNPARRRMKARMIVLAMSGSAASRRRNSAEAHLPPVHAHPPAHEDRAIVEQVELAGELVVAVDGHDVRLSVGSGLVDLDEAVEHEEEVHSTVVSLEQDGALRQGLDGPELGHPPRLLAGQARKGLGFAGIGIRGVELRGLEKRRSSGQRSAHGSRWTSIGGPAPGATLSWTSRNAPRPFRRTP